MTTRKPPNVSVRDWVERQIRTAEAAGDFANLPGAGKPIADIDAPQHELAWLANYLRRENADPLAVLPPALALAKEVEQLPERLIGERSEARARAVIEDLNTRIGAAYAAPQIGPPLRVKLVQVDTAISDWERARAALRAARAAERAPQPLQAAPPRRWRRRRRAAVADGRAGSTP